MTCIVSDRHGRKKITLTNAVGLAHAAMALWSALERKGHQVSSEFLKDKVMLKVSKAGFERKLYVKEA